MADIQISRNHKMTVKQAKEMVESLVKEFGNYMNGVTWSWKGNDAVFSVSSGVAKGVNGKISLAEKSVEIIASLPFLLRTMKKTISSKLEAKLDELLQ